MAKRYSDRSKASQRKIDREIARNGWNRDTALGWLRKGVWSPFARDRENRVPQTMRLRETRISEGGRISDRYRTPDIGDLRQAAESAGNSNFRGEIGFKPADFGGYIDRIDSVRGLEIMASTSYDDWVAYASIQGDKNNPTEIPPAMAALAAQLGVSPDDLSWFDDNGHWHSIFWYH